jgi:hypothetical protein
MSTEKNNKIKELEKEIKEGKIQMEIDKKSIEEMKTHLCNLNGGFQVCKTSVYNIMEKFNLTFPEYSIKIETE